MLRSFGIFRDRYSMFDLYSTESQVKQSVWSVGLEAVDQMILKPT